ncbi:kinesin heavy chain [Plasmopara halstedii]|uniref:Kinesin-like protein n=1 Tax=Plasmopara halstedii TaxID=4781 RepID=A0A0N7L622_PLAHL|nr:kinesin heavy chain [Plasmopara halstedii]CEG43067.1 kinesin heavy chain [Plasmopara halstedii]|eukprot:XP_024579436.1 kinesin heavy chain [Plasmopara halstedii]
MDDVSKSESRSVERVKVFCRVRPLLQRERDGWSYDEYCQHLNEDNQRLDHNESEHPATELTPETSEPDLVTFITEKGRQCTPSLLPSVIMQSDDRSVTFQASNAAHGEVRSFEFDGTFTETSTQEKVFDRVAAPIVEDVMAGYNGTILAYGQTATGKTHTMVGPDDLVQNDERGVIPRALEDIFTRAEATRTHAKTTVALSYVQIYCERLFDLLEPETVPGSILIREDIDRGVYIDGAAIVSVATVDECWKLLKRGNEHRAVSSTHMNAQSSRSHTILILRIERKEFAPSSTTHPVIRLSHLYLVDLAGSERVKKARVFGRHLNELKAINLSLSALGNCISALSKQSQQTQMSYHVPYRDSKLTRLLQSSLGGNAKTALIITVTPALTEALETLQTLQFGHRAMKVTVRPHRSALSVLDYRTLYEEMRQALDEEQERSQQAQVVAIEEKNRARNAEDQLTQARSQIQVLEFELKAVRTATRHDRESVDRDDDLEQMRVEIQHLVTQHAQDVAQVNNACTRQVETYKRLADEASQEWHDLEGELAGEKTQVLHTLRELKEFKMRFFQLEEETTERIAELVQEERDCKKERNGAMATVKILEKELETLRVQIRASETQREKLQDQLDAEFVPKETLQQMEDLYEGAISKLQTRVGCLEKKALDRRTISSIKNSNNNTGQQRSLPEIRKASAVPKIGRMGPGTSSCRFNATRTLH